jgi:hypothetical protein
MHQFGNNENPVPPDEIKPTQAPQPINQQSQVQEVQGKEKQDYGDFFSNRILSLPLVFWKTLRETLSKSKVHGWGNIFATTNPIVCITWTILVLAGVGAAIFFMYLSTKDYFNYEVTTTIESISENPSNFP